MIAPSKSAGTPNSSGSGSKTSKIATLRGGFRASEPVAHQRIDLFDDIHRRLTQLIALLSSIYGDGFESFSNMNGDTQDHILWLAADLAHDAQIDLKALSDLDRRSRA